ncbi:MAG TPA: GntR family transcriptional regulator [Firmicutes bacterium]|nr:GntR family transcriptional regulator [Bacillota bacterium]
MASSQDSCPYENSRPIYLQIMDRIRRRIAAGEWRAGERVPPVRDLALEFGVNPNTMQRSLSELEREGLLYSERTAGRYITADTALIGRVREEMARRETEAFLRRMAGLGCTRGEIRRFLETAAAQLEEAGEAQGP